MRRIESHTFYPINSFIGGKRIIIILLCENASGSFLLCQHKCIQQINLLCKFVDTAGWMQKPVPWISSSSKYVPPCGEFLTVYCRCEGLAIDFFIVMSCIQYYFFMLVFLWVSENSFCFCKSFILIFPPSLRTKSSYWIANVFNPFLYSSSYISYWINPLDYRWRTLAVRAGSNLVILSY